MLSRVRACRGYCSCESCACSLHILPHIETAIMASEAHGSHPTPSHALCAHTMCNAGTGPSKAPRYNLENTKGGTGDAASHQSPPRRQHASRGACARDVTHTHTHTHFLSLSQHMNPSMGWLASSCRPGTLPRAIGAPEHTHTHTHVQRHKECSNVNRDICT